MLKIAIERSDEIMSACSPIMRTVGVDFDRRRGSGFIRSSNFPAEVVVIERENILNFLSLGMVDVVLCNELTVSDYSCRPELPSLGKGAVQKREFDIIHRSGMGRSSLSLYIPIDTKYRGLEWFSNKVIVAEYESLLNRFLRSNGIKSTILPLQSGFDIVTEAGLADAVCVSLPEGDTLPDNGYKSVETVECGEIVAVAGPDMPPSTRMILDDFMTRILSAHHAKGKKSVTMSVPVDSISQLTKSIQTEGEPVVLCDNARRTAFVNMIIDDTRLWDSMEKLKILGACNIAVSNIENLVYRK